MARKAKQEEAPVGAPLWLNTFADLMNLLLCFFVLLFSMSTVSQEKYEKVIASMSNSVSIFSGGGAGIGQGELISSGVSQLNNLDEYFSDMGKANDSDTESEDDDPLKEYEKKMFEQKKENTTQMYEELSELVDKNKVDQYVNLDIDSNYQFVRLSMNGAVLFDSGRADIIEEAKPILNKLGDILKQYDKYLIKIEGHTDNVQLTNNRLYKNNMELSVARASMVWEYLTSEKGLNPLTLEAAGRSEYDPIASNSTEKGRAKNRRVEFKIYQDK